MPVASQCRQVDTRKGTPSAHRQGAAVLVVFLLTGLAVAYAYAALRIQTIQHAIIRNVLLESTARQGAVTGLFLALKQMHHSWWTGVDTTYSATINEGVQVTASYLQGDPNLTSTDPRWQEYPYRIRIEVTAQATSPSSAAVRCQKRLGMVVRLVPRQVNPTPAGWSELISHTLCQWRAGICQLQTPFRVEGPVRLREKLDIANTIDWSTSARWDWCWSLRSLYWQGQGDFRPFMDTVYLPFSRQQSGTVALLTQAIGVTAIDTGVSAVYSWASVPRTFRYSLFPKGKVYDIPLDERDALQSSQILPDPMTNPLGIFLRVGGLELLGEVRLEGTILLAESQGSLRVKGPNNQLVAPVLPPYPEIPSADEVRVRLPAVIAQHSVVVESDGQLSGSGLILAQNDFTIAKASQDSPIFSWQGNVAATNFRIAPRTQWELPDKVWTQLYTSFRMQSGLGDQIFSRWLEANAGLKFRPKILIRPLADGSSHHWLTSGQSVFVPHPNDTTPMETGNAGLRWEVIRVRAVPSP